jgi:hypothetical protein
MIEVFKTDISLKEDAERVVQYLQLHLQPHRATIDLHDCDKILRIDAESVLIPVVQEMVSSMGFFCEVLE